MAFSRRSTNLLEKRKPLVLNQRLCLFFYQGDYFVKILLSQYMNSTSLKWAAKAGIAIGTSGSCMSFEACERSNLQNSVPFEGFGMARAFESKML
jgi:hypothetical protein